jgi:Na+-driven multidrug efflux pump
MFFVFLSIPLNYYLINRFGLVGSAYANFIATFIYNLVRLLFILKLFKMQPYSFKNANNSNWRNRFFYQL